MTIKYYRMFPPHIQELASAPTVPTQDSASQDSAYPASTSTKQSLSTTTPTNQSSSTSTAAPTNQALFAPAIPQDRPILNGEENDKDDDMSVPPKKNLIWSTKCKSCPLFGHTRSSSHNCLNNPINESRQVLISSPNIISSYPHLDTFSRICQAKKTYVLTGVYSLFFLIDTRLC